MIFIEEKDNNFPNNDFFHIFVASTCLVLLALYLATGGQSDLVQTTISPTLSSLHCNSHIYQYSFVLLIAQS